MSDEGAPMAAKPDPIRPECRSVMPRYIFLLLLVGTVSTLWWNCRFDPTVIYLQKEPTAEWIGYRRPFELNSHRNENLRDRAEFRKTIVSERSATPITLKVKYFRRVEIFLDSASLYRSPEDNERRNWREPVAVSLGDSLSQGEHELRIVVENENGPALLWVSCEVLGLKTDSTWRARYRELDWSSAMTISETPEAPAIVNKYGTPSDAIRELWPWFALVFLGCSLLTFLATNKSDDNRLKERLQGWVGNPKFVRMLLYLFWVLFAVNSLKKVPLQGFDFPAHLLYIEYMTEHWMPPFATDGWQMFQTPLYYYVASWFLQLGTAISSEHTGFVFVQFVSLVCGLLQIELCYRYAKLLFPKRNDLQIWGMLIGGLLPMNLYMSQGLGNEPLAGVFIAWAFYLALRMYCEPAKYRTTHSFRLLGIVLGLAMLAKVTAVLLVLPIFLLLYLSSYSRSQSWKETWKISLKPMTIAITICVLVCGWYFVRNWIELGTPYMGGWDSARGFEWWQDPGYRSFDQIASFGGALSEPIYAARFGLWDALYSSFWWDGYLGGVIDYESRPPWRESWLLASVWFSVVPMVLLLSGFLRGIRKTVSSSANEISVMTICIAIYLSAIVLLYFRLPIYSTAKASYTMGLIPVFGVYSAWGMEWLGRNRWVRIVLHGSLGCWFFSVIMAYFAR